MQINSGDIFWIAPQAFASTATGPAHPHVVVQDNVFNHSRIDMVVVCALTSNLHRASEPGNVLLEVGEGRLARQSVVVVSQISSVRKEDLGERIGVLSEERVEQILDGLRFQQRSFFGGKVRVIEPWEQGIVCLEQRAYWDAHEAWEAIWTALPASALRDNLQGLIQFAAACYKPQQVRAGKSEAGMQRGMAALLASAAGYLGVAARESSEKFGRNALDPAFDVAVVQAGIERLQHVLDAWRAGALDLSSVEDQVHSIAEDVAGALCEQTLGSAGFLVREP